MTSLIGTAWRSARFAGAMGLLAALLVAVPVSGRRTDRWAQASVEAGGGYRPAESLSEHGGYPGHGAAAGTLVAPVRSVVSAPVGDPGDPRRADRRRSAGGNRARLAKPVRALVTAVLLLGSFLFDGHTVVKGPRVLMQLADVTHTAAAAVWVGGVAMMALLLLKRGRRGAPVAVVAALGLHNNNRVVPALEEDQDGPDPTRRLRRTVAIEATAMASVMLATAVLVASAT